MIGEAGGAQGRHHGRVGVVQLDTVDAVEPHRRQAAAGNELREARRRGDEFVGVGGGRQEGAPAALQVGGERSPVQDDVGAGDAACRAVAAAGSGHASAAPWGLAGSVAASTTVTISSPSPTSRSDRSRSTAPGRANWAPPRPSTK